MSEERPYAHLLKRIPTQRRSAARVEAILDACAALLADRDPDEISVRDLAAAAGVPTGTIYQFFEDKNVVMQALAASYIDEMPRVLVADDETDDLDWSEIVDLVVDAYASMIREHPALRRLWLTGSLDSSTRGLERKADQAIAAEIHALIRANVDGAAGSVDEWAVLVALIDGLLHYAFAESPVGDERVLAEARRAARAYAGVVIGESDRS